MPDNQHTGRLPRTELWIADRVFRGLGLADDAAGHIALAERLSFDYVFFPCGESANPAPGLNYRRFSPADITGIHAPIPAGIILDGPFSRLVKKRGLTPVLLAWKVAGIREQLERETAKLLEVLSSYAALHPEIVVIADDIAYDRSTYINPEQLRRLFPCYKPMIDAVHAAGARALFHSDGRLVPVMEDIIEAGFDGLAGCQSDCNRDAFTTPRDILVLGGIDAPQLGAKDGGDSGVRRQFIETIGLLRKNCYLALCSSCGISSLAELERLSELYRWVDQCGVSKTSLDYR